LREEKREAAACAVRGEAAWQRAARGERRRGGQRGGGKLRRDFFYFLTGITAGSRAGGDGILQPAVMRYVVVVDQCK
jgi:hypothetical protein